MGKLEVSAMDQMNLMYTKRWIRIKIKSISVLEEKESIVFDVIKTINDTEYDKIYPIYQRLDNIKKERFFEDIDKNGMTFLIDVALVSSGKLSQRIKTLYEKYGDIIDYDKGDTSHAFIC